MIPKYEFNMIYVRKDTWDLLFKDGRHQWLEGVITELIAIAITVEGGVANRDKAAWGASNTIHLERRLPVMIEGQHNQKLEGVDKNSVSTHAL